MTRYCVYYVQMMDRSSRVFVSLRAALSVSLTPSFGILHQLGGFCLIDIFQRIRMQFPILHRSVVLQLRSDQECLIRTTSAVRKPIQLSYSIPFVVFRLQYSAMNEHSSKLTPPLENLVESVFSRSMKLVPCPLKGHLHHSFSIALDKEASALIIEVTLILHQNSDWHHASSLTLLLLPYQIHCGTLERPTNIVDVLKRTPH